MSQVCNVCGYTSTPARNCARCGGQNTMRDDRQQEIDSIRARVEELEDRLAAWEPVVRAVGVWFDAPRDSDGERMAEIDIADSYCDIPPEHRPEVEP